MIANLRLGLFLEDVDGQAVVVGEELGQATEVFGGCVHWWGTKPQRQPPSTRRLPTWNVLHQFPQTHR